MNQHTLTLILWRNFQRNLLLYCEFIPPELILANHDMIAIVRLRRQYNIMTKDVSDICIVKDSLKWYRKHLFELKNLVKYWNKAEESAYIKAGWITVEMKGTLMTHAGFWHWDNNYAQISSLIDILQVTYFVNKFLG